MKKLIVILLIACFAEGCADAKFQTGQAVRTNKTRDVRCTGLKYK